MSLYRRILCPVDGSAPSREALHAAAELAAAEDAQLTLLHVADDPARAGHELAPPAGAWKLEAEQLAHRSVNVVVTSGTPWERIVAYAREHGNDLIVVGSAGHGCLRRALLGSVAERVLRHASCPVLIARAAPPPLS